MWKITFVLLALTCGCYGGDNKDEKKDDNDGNDFGKLFNNFGGAENKNFPPVPPFPKLPFDFPTIKPGTLFDPEAIKNMKCEGLSNCKATLHSESSNTEIVNGKVVKDDEKVDDIKNINGKVDEEHFKKTLE